MDQAILWVAVAGVLAGAGLALFHRSRVGGAVPGAGRQTDALAVLGLKADEALARIAPPPANTLRTAMEARGIGFRDAVIATAKDDTLR